MKKTLALALGASVVALVATLGLKAPAQSSTASTFAAKIPLNEWTAVAQQKGWLQAEFAKHGATTELVDVTAMGAEAALLDKGGLHFAFRMQYPALLHKLNGLDAEIIWLSEKAQPRRNTIVVPKDSPVKSVADLKDKKLGVWRVSCPYFSAYELLKAKGVPIDTQLAKGAVRHENIQGPASTAALLAGRLDALSLHPSTALAAPLYTEKIIKEVSASLPNGVYLNGGGRTSIFAIKGFAKQRPELVKAFLSVRDKTVKWILKNPDEAAGIVSKELRIPKYVAKFMITDDSSYSFAPGESDYKDAIQSLKLFQDWGIKNGDDFLTKKHLSDAQIEAFVDRRFFKGGQYSIY